ncbi:MAG: hypothetical protein AB2533_15300, partial [Candidatus Thiodiazotropha endolucinida]
MSNTKLVIALSGLFTLAACSQSDNQQSATTSQETQGSSTSMVDKVSEAGSKAADTIATTSKEAYEGAKQMGSDAADAVVYTSKEIYVSTIQAASDAGSAIKDETKEFVSAVGEKSAEVYDAAKTK